LIFHGFILFIYVIANEAKQSLLTMMGIASGFALAMTDY